MNLHSTFAKNLRNAIRHHDLDAVEKCLAADDGPPAGEALYQTPWLQYACFFGSREIVELLVNRGCDVNEVSARESTPLSSASRAGNVETVRYLLDEGAHVSSKSAMRNPLFGCIIHQSDNPSTQDTLEIASILIDRGIDTTVRYDMRYGKGIDAKAFAWMWGRRDIARLIAEHEANGDPQKAEELLAEAEATVKNRSWEHLEEND